MSLHFVQKKLMCAECNLRFESREHLVAHVENFCVDSEWANPEEKKRQLVKQFEADIRRDQVSDHPVGWAEVDMYLQRENRVRYIPDETERQVSQRSVLGHMTLGSLREHFRTDHHEFGNLREHISDHKRDALVEGLAHFKMRRSKERKLEERKEQVDLEKLGHRKASKYFDMENGLIHRINETYYQPGTFHDA